MQLVHKICCLLNTTILNCLSDTNPIVQRAQIHRGFHSGFLLKFLRGFLETLYAMKSTNDVTVRSLKSCKVKRRGRLTCDQIIHDQVVHGYALRIRILLQLGDPLILRYVNLFLRVAHSSSTISIDVYSDQIYRRPRYTCRSDRITSLTEISVAV